MKTVAFDRSAARRAVRAVAGALVIALVGGCSMPLVDSRCRAGEQAAAIDSLYFGTASADGTVLAEDWARFVSEVVTPRFSQGLTSWAASGQWRDGAGKVRKESSYVLLVVHPDANAADTAIREIIDIYKARFHQEGVLRVRSTACASF